MKFYVLIFVFFLSCLAPIAAQQTSFEYKKILEDMAINFGVDFEDLHLTYFNTKTGIAFTKFDPKTFERSIYINERLIENKAKERYLSKDSICGKIYRALPMAHELAHHIMGHTFTKNTIQNEIKADLLAANLLYKLYPNLEISDTINLKKSIAWAFEDYTKTANAALFPHHTKRAELVFHRLWLNLDRANIPIRQKQLDSLFKEIENTNDSISKKKAIKDGYLKDVSAAANSLDSLTALYADAIKKDTVFIYDPKLKKVICSDTLLKIDTSFSKKDTLVYDMDTLIIKDCKLNSYSKIKTLKYPIWGIDFFISKDSSFHSSDSSLFDSLCGSKAENCPFSKLKNYEAEIDEFKVKIRTPLEKDYENKLLSHKNSIDQIDSFLRKNKNVFYFKILYSLVNKWENDVKEWLKTKGDIKSLNEKIDSLKIKPNSSIFYYQEYAMGHLKEDSIKIQEIKRCKSCITNSYNLNTFTYKDKQVFISNSLKHTVRIKLEAAKDTSYFKNVTPTYKFRFGGDRFIVDNNNYLWTNSPFIEGREQYTAVAFPTCKEMKK